MLIDPIFEVIQLADFPIMNFAARIDALRHLAGLHPGDTVYVTAMSNIKYLTGFSGSAGIMLAGHDAAYLVTDGRYEEIANAECAGSGIQVIGADSASRDDRIASLLSDASRLIIDPKQLSVEDYWRLGEVTPGITVEQRSGLPEQLRLTKDAGEVERIREACRIAARAFDDVVMAMLPSGPTEKQLANRLEARMKELGADDIGFATIVASGPNSWKPHAHPGSRVIREGEPVVIDFGAVIDGYHSDATRTVWYGELDKTVRAIYEAARDAHQAEVAAIRPGVSHAEVDAASRRSFIQRGFEEKPLHPSGHSLGLDIHERPFLTPSAEAPVLEGYVIAVEPGLYIPGIAGCRIENTVVVGADQAEVLP